MSEEYGLLSKISKTAMTLDDFKKRVIPMNEQIKVVVSSQRVAPSDIWFIRHEDADILSELTAAMDECYNNEDMEWQVVCHKPRVGNVVACRFEDGYWYRAMVLESVDEVRTRVRFLDYGNESVVQRKDIQELKGKFTSEPLMAIHCSLANVIPISGKWSSEATGFLSEILPIQCVCLLTAHNGNSDKYNVSLSYEAGDDIGKMMIQARFALRLPKAASACVPPNQDLPSSRQPSSSNTRQPCDGGMISLASENSRQKDLPVSIFPGSSSTNGTHSRSSTCPLASKTTEQRCYQSFASQIPDNVMPRQHEEAIETPDKARKISDARMISDKHKVNQSSRSVSVNEDRKRLNTQIYPSSQPIRTASPLVCHPHAGFSKEQIVRGAVLRFRGTQRCPTAGSKVIVSHANSPSDFYVLLQDVTSKVELQFVHNFLDHYLKCNGDSYRPSRVGWRVCARYQGTWYRAIVTEILHSNLVKVLLVDFGNTEEVTPEELRCVPGKVWSGLPAWQALNCGLLGQYERGIKPAWSAQDMSWFSENCTDRSFTVSSAVYRQETEFGVELDLEFAQPIDGFKTLSEILVSRKFGGTQVVSGSCLMETLHSRTSSAIPKEFGDNRETTSLQRAPNEAESARHSDLGKIGINLELGRCRLKDLPAQEVIGDNLVEVLLIDHPDSFWCQDLVLMQEFAKDGPITPSAMVTPYVPVVDEVCLGYHEEYSVWYRAVVTSVTSDRAMVKWIDYGDDAVAEFANLRPLIEERLKYPRLAYHCSLADVKTPNGTVDWSTESTEGFKSCVLETLMKMNIVETSRSGMSYVQLTVVESGTSVSSLLISSGLAVDL